jgi:hypothetical protein
MQLKHEDTQKYPHGLVVPCGGCYLCRIAKRREWTLRLTHELATSDSGIFVTLTYDDENLPFNTPSDFPTLKKKHLQDFFKRLRKRLGDRKIKYFACGEYGDEGQRPHYHAIITNMSNVSDCDRSDIVDSWGHGWPRSPSDHKCFGNAEFDSIQYVAGYIDKKFNGDLAKEEYVKKHREPVFRLLSNGLGKQFALDNADQIKSNMYVSLRGNKMNVPRYYVDILDIDPDVLYEVSREREQAEVLDIIGMNISRSELLSIDDTGNKLIVLDHDRKKAKQTEKNLKSKKRLKPRNSF